MKLSTFIIAVMAFVAVTITVLSLTFDMYDNDGYDVNLSNNSDTAHLATLQSNAEQTQAELLKEQKLLANKTVGQPGAELKQGTISDADLVTSSFSALARIPNYGSTFLNFINPMASAMGLGDNPIITFLIASLIIIITLLLLGVVFKNVVLS
jgi:hypothetical protein